MEPMCRVYLSSTRKDLLAHRVAALRQIATMNMVGVAMEGTSAEEGAPLDVCLANVRSCDVYVGVFGFRYGFIPPGHAQSITELEYRTAGDAGIPRLVFVAEPHQWDLAFVDAMTGDGDHGERIKQLRAELESSKTVAYFTTPEVLASQVAAALHDWAQDRTRATQSVPQRALKIYLEDCITREAKLEGRYVHLSGTATRTILPPTQIPMQLVPRSFRIVGMRQPHSIENELLPSIASVVERYPQVVLVGDPGSGKSTTLHYLHLTEAKRALASAGRVPLLINLAEWPESIPDLKTLLVHEREVRGCPSIPASEYILLLDGLNEVSEQHYSARLSSIQKWIDDNPATQVVLTSREQQYLQGKQLRIPTVTIHPLSDPQIEEFMRNYLGESDAAGLLVSIGWDSRVRTGTRHLSRLAQNPFQLMLMCFVYANQKSLPSTRGELLRILTKTLYQRELDHHRHGELAYEELQAGLGELALSAVQVRSATAIEETWAAKNMPKGLDFATVRTLGVNMGLLRRSKKDRYIQFVHQLVLEYFAGERLSFSATRLEKVLRTPRFRNGSRRAQAADEVCITFTELASDPAAAVSAISRIDPYLAVDILSQTDRARLVDDTTRVTLARGLLRVHDADRHVLISRLQMLESAALIPLRELLASSSKAERRLAVESLAAIEYPETIQELYVALKDSNRWVRREAAAAIRRLTERRPDIAAVFLREKLPLYGPHESNELVKLLSPSPPPEPYEPFPTVELPRPTAELPLSGDDALIAELLNAVMSSATFVHAKSSAKSKSQQPNAGDSAHSEPEADAGLPLQELMQNLAVAPHGTSGWVEKQLVRMGSDAVPILLEAIHSPDERLRGRVVRVLAHVRDPRVIDPLKALIYDRNSDLAFHAVRALAGQCDKTLVPVLAEFADSWSARMRKAALRGLLQCGKPGLQVVLQSVHDPVPIVRAESIRLLTASAVMVDPEMIAPLLSDPSRTVGHAALMWLLLIEPERAFSELLTLLQSPEPTEQFYAVDQVVDVFAQISGRAPLFGNRPLLREQDVTHFGAVIRAKRLEIGIRLAAMMRIAKAKSDLRRHAALALYLLFEDDHNLLRIALRDVDVLREVGLVSG